MTETLRLIALTGRAGAGKDSVAATLVRHCNYQTIAFADALRAEVAAAWRIDPRMLQDPATKEWPIPALAVGNCGDPDFGRLLGPDALSEPRSPRWIMQHWGDYQKARRGEGHYAHTVLRWVGRHIDCGARRLLVTDLRFAIEYETLHPASERLRVVRVHRPGLPPPADHGTARHASEREWVTVPTDADLVNDGTLEDLVHATLRMEAALYADDKGAQP